MIKRSALFLVAACLPAFGDFSYDETSKITGGMMAGVMKFAGAFSKQAREPMVSTVAVKGNRMVHGSQHHASVIDLDSETITEINFDKKQYSVMTFAQMKQMMDEMSQKMKSSSDAQKADVHFKVSAKVEALYDQPKRLPAQDEGSEMAKLRREMDRRMLGNGYCARPVELDCHFESICESCCYFVTTPEFTPILLKQRDDAAAKGQVGRQRIFEGLLARLQEGVS